MRIRLRLVALALILAAASTAAQTPTQKIQLAPVGSAPSAWTTLASDPKGDGLQARLPDAKELSYAIDQKSDRVWFKVTVYDPLPERWFGMSVTIDGDGIPDNGMTWWGTNKVKFDRVASAFLFRADDYWQGYVGVGDTDGIGRGTMTGITRDVKVAVDRENRAILLGVPRAALGTAPTVRVIATVGSMLTNNDDIPNEGMVSVSLR